MSSNNINTVNKVFNLPTDKVLSYDEFKELIQKEMGEFGENNNGKNIAGGVATVTAANNIVPPQQQENNNNNGLLVQDPWQMPPRANENPNPLLPNGRPLPAAAADAERANILNGLIERLAQVLGEEGNAAGGGGGMEQQHLQNLNRQAQAQQQQAAAAQQDPLIVRLTPNILFLKSLVRFLYRTIHWCVTTVISLLFGTLFPMLGGLFLIVMMVGADVGDIRLWRIVGFFVALKFAKWIADKVRLNVVIPNNNNNQQNQQNQNQQNNQNQVHGVQHNNNEQQQQQQDQNENHHQQQHVEGGKNRDRFGCCC